MEGWAYQPWLLRPDQAQVSDKEGDTSLHSSLSQHAGDAVHAQVPTEAHPGAHGGHTGQDDQL